MKLDARQIEGFLRDPGAAQVVLLLGDDVGLIRERAKRLVVAVTGAVDDPFRVVELDRETIGAVPEELASMVIELLTNSYMNAEVVRVDGGIRMPPK